MLGTKTLALELRPKEGAWAGHVEKNWGCPCRNSLEGLEYIVGDHNWECLNGDNPVRIETRYH